MTFDGTEIAVEKARLRDTFQDIRAGIRNDERAAALRAMAGHLDRSGLIRPGLIVASYAAIGTEIDAQTVLADVLARCDIQQALPVVIGKAKPLVFRAWTLGEALETSRFGIPEPTAAAIEVRPDVLLVPLLAVDRDGYRLGYGGGFYDRTLASLRANGSCAAIGLAFSAQCTGRLPRGPNDVPVDFVLTENGLTQPRDAV